MSARMPVHDEEISEINMTPFVDIVLVILVIFMATATFVAQGKIPITLPQASTTPEKPTKLRPAVITVDADGTYYFDDVSMPLAMLETKLGEHNATKEGVILRSDATAPFRFVVAAIDACKRNGVAKFSIRTQEMQP